MDEMGVGWVRWSMGICGMSVWVCGMSVWVSSISTIVSSKSSIAVSTISPSSVTGISVVEVSWISISFSFTFAKDVGAKVSIWVTSISSIGNWGSMMVGEGSWSSSSNDGWGGKSLNFYFSWCYFDRFDN